MGTCSTVQRPFPRREIVFAIAWVLALVCPASPRDTEDANEAAMTSSKKAQGGSEDFCDERMDEAADEEGMERAWLEEETLALDCTFDQFNVRDIHDETASFHGRTDVAGHGHRFSNVSVEI